MLGGFGQHRQLGQLLCGKRQPRADLGVDAGLGGQAHRYVQQRARGGYHHLAAETAELLYERKRGVEVVHPDVAAVDDPGEQHPVPDAADVLQEGQVLLAPAEVQADPLDGQVGQDLHRLADAAEEGGDSDARARRRRPEAPVGAPDRLELGGAAVFDECRFVEAHPRSTRGAELCQDLDVDLDEPVEERQAIEARHLTGAASQEGERPEQDPGGRDPEAGGLYQLTDGLGRVRRERRVRADFGHQLVIVGVEPLGELEWRHRHAVELPTAGHGEVPVEVDSLPRRAEASRDGPDGSRGIEHVVIEREGVGRHEVDSCHDQLLPVFPSYCRRSVLEISVGRLAGPVALQRPLQLAIRADPGHSVHCGPHATSLFSLPVSMS